MRLREPKHAAAPALGRGLRGSIGERKIQAGCALEWLVGEAGGRPMVSGRPAATSARRSTGRPRDIAAILSICGAIGVAAGSAIPNS